MSRSSFLIVPVFSILGILIDTNIAVHLQDGEPEVTARLRQLNSSISLSIVSRVELENGVHRDPKWTKVRRAALAMILTRILTVDFSERELVAYRGILEAMGYSRSKVIDRMIAATALANNLELVTMNGSDFCNIAGLRVQVWPSP